MKNNVFRLIQRIIYSSILGLILQPIVSIDLFAVSSSGDISLQDVRVKMSRENISLEQAFQIIEQQTDFKFFYIKEDLPLHEKIALSPAAESLYSILREMAKECGLTFNRVDHQIVVKKDSNRQSETYKVEGIVRDGSTHEALVFANIIVKGTQQGMTTDANGKFSLTLPQGNDTLRCRFVGYKPLEIPLSVNSSIHLSINLFAMDVYLQDVTVYANPDNDELSQKEVTALSLQSETIGKITGIMPDVLRSVQMLPGVSSDNELSAKFNVHGGDANENLVLIDGTQVYDPYHIKEVSNVSIGIFNVDMIEKMDLMTGGFSARYGDRMSSVVDIEYREGTRDRIKGQVSLSMTDFDALLEGPLGSSGSFIIGARQSYTQYILKLLNEAPQIHPSFYDIQGVLAYQLTPQNKLLLKFIHAGDTFIYDPTTSSSSAYSNPFQTTDGYVGSLTQSWHDSTEEHAHYYSSMFAIQSSNIISSAALLKSEISYYDEIESEHSVDSDLYGYVFKNSSLDVFYDTTSVHLYDNELHIRTLEFNSVYDMQVSHLYGIKTGASYQRIFYYQQLMNQQTYFISTNRDNLRLAHRTGIINSIDNAVESIDAQTYKMAGYLENIFQLGEKVILNIGGRFDYFDINRDLTWSPRMNIACNIYPELTVRGAWGYFYQSPIYQQLAYSTASDTNTQSQRAIHYVLGADYDIISDAENHNILKFKFEAYHKTYSDLISSTISSFGRISYSRKNDALGRASGFDAYMMFSTKGLSGWISYSFLNADQKMTLNDTIGYFPRSTDQHHTLAAVADIDLGKSWSMEIRLVYGSGYPYTPYLAVYDGFLREWNWVLGKPNSAYLPAYERVDIRVSKDFELFGFPSSAFLDISNIFNVANIQAYGYQHNFLGYPEVIPRNLWPILPTLGMTVRF
jgi:hypothetical protein